MVARVPALGEQGEIPAAAALQRWVCRAQDSRSACFAGAQFSWLLPSDGFIRS